MAWTDTTLEQLESRDSKVSQLSQIVACFSQLALNTERLYDQCLDLTRKLKQSDIELQQARFQLQLTQRPLPTDVKRLSDLEVKYASVKDERSELYKAASQSTLKLLELTEQVKQRDQIINGLELELKQNVQMKTRWDQRQVDYENLVSEKNFTIQILQDELTALQLELLNNDFNPVRLTNTASNASITSAPDPRDDKFEVVQSSRVLYKFARLEKFDRPQSKYSCADIVENLIVLGTNSYALLNALSLGDTQVQVKVNAVIVKVSLALLKSKNTVLLARQDGIVSLVNAETYKLRSQLISPDSTSLLDMHSPEGEHLWTLSPNCLKYWHCERALCLRTIQFHQMGECTSFCMQQDVGYVGGRNGSVWRLNVASGDMKLVLQDPKRALVSLALSPKHIGLLIVVYKDKVVLVQRDKPIHSFSLQLVVTSGGFLNETLVYIATENKLHFYGLSGFELEQQLEFPEPIVQVFKEYVICEHSVYKLSN